MKRCLRAAFLVSAALLALAGRHDVVVAQSRPAEYPDTVVEVRVEGNKALSEASILNDVRTRPGQPYSDDVVREDQQRLLKTRRFDNVVATKTQTDKGLLVVFTVAERPVIEAVRFQGNKEIKTKDVQKVVTFGPRDPIDRFAIETGRRAIETLYRSKGYYFAEVALDEDALKEHREVVYTLVEGPQATVRKVSFVGAPSFRDMRLRTLVSTQAKLWPFIAGTLDSETIDRDVTELRNFYRGEGFLDAQVGRELTFSPDKQKVTVIFKIEEGPRYHVRQVTFEGNQVFSEDEIRRHLKLQQGATFNGQDLRRDAEKVRNLYGEIGFINAETSVRTRYAAPPGTAPAEEASLVDLVYSIREAQQFRLGAVDIRGNKLTKENVVRRQLQFSPGQLYNTVAVDETRRRLLETRLFEKVNITPYGEEEGVRNALVEVQEAKTAEFLIGVGVSSNIGLLGNISYVERNFDIFNWPGSPEAIRRGQAFKGGGQVFSISAEPGLKFSRLRMDWQEPSLMDLPYTLGAGLYAFTTERETYDETRYGGYASFGRRFPNRWYAELAGRAEGINIGSLSHKAPQDVLDEKGSHFLSSVKGSLIRDMTDSRWLPSKGDRLSLSYEQALAEYTFGKAVADYHIYHTVYQDVLNRKHILAGRGMVGDIFGDAPMFERFYGGGLGSIRGFEYRGISPRQGSTFEQVGGDFTVFLGGEYTFPVIGDNLRGAVFVDTGTVEDGAGFGDYRASAGFGLRLNLPFFGPVPMSLDFGFPIKKGAHDDSQLVSFSVGWVF